MEVGVSTQFFQLKYAKYSKLVTKTWATSIWDVLENSKSSIELLDHHQCKMPRKGDKFFMEIMIVAGISGDMLIQINQIRLYLKILTLSDIIEIGSRTKILKLVIEATESRSSSWNWPKIKMIDPKCVKIWENVIATIILPYIQLHALGKWRRATY